MVHRNVITLLSDYDKTLQIDGSVIALLDTYQEYENTLCDDHDVVCEKNSMTLFILEASLLHFEA